ncbi:MAG TPA: hypothetical protein VKP69_26890, partial [Isosphaeraceae bacterium]|nr:hypothetical protein [Isosphaeraceae bacterium]
SDFLLKGGTVEDLFRLVEAAPAWEPAKGRVGDDPANGAGQRNGTAKPSANRDSRDGHKVEVEKESQAQTILHLAKSAVLFHTADGKAFATIPVNGHRENHPIRSKAFKSWLTRAFYDAQGRPPSSEAMQAALGLLEAKAEFDGLAEPVWTRVARVANPADPDDPTYYLDLCNGHWGVVEITRKGWQVIDESPVKFRRAKGMRPLPTPVLGGAIDELRPYVNLASDADWRLFVACLTGALRPHGPYPIVAINGEQGSAKSTTSRVFRRLIDPHVTPIRCEPREIRDLMIAATNAWTVALDNISSLPVWFSDALCRLATGGGFSTRTLYENDEETFFDAMRPILLNGIEDVATRFDLLDRSVVLSLPTIPEDRRREEEPFWRAFEAAHPQILGALLDAVVGGLRTLPSVQLDRLPRMADFARWGEAVGRSLGWGPGAFLKSYEANRASANEVAVEASAVSLAIRGMMAQRQEEWTGTATELLQLLVDQAVESATRDKDWPKTANALTNRLKRAAPAIRKVGVEIIFNPRTNSKRTITIRVEPERVGETSSPASPASPDPGSCGHKGQSDEGLRHADRPDSASNEDRHGIVTDRQGSSRPGPRENSDNLNSDFDLADIVPAPRDERDASDDLFPILSGAADEDEEVTWIA